jgi:DNA-binding GntR family transcriptional regulator
MTAKIMELAPISRPTTLKAHVYGLLREAIVSGKYKPGSRLNESQLARELNISRIPIREALMQLHEHGLVMNHERRGMFVTELEDVEVQQINGLRVVLEAEAIRLCRARMTRQLAAKLTALVEQMEKTSDTNEIDMANVDMEFHRTVWKATGNPYLAKTMESLTTVLFAHTALENVSHEDAHWRLNHHRELLDVILGKSDLTAEEAVIRHLRMHYPDPAQYSSFSVANQADVAALAAPAVKLAQGAGKSPVKRPKNLKA